MCARALCVTVRVAGISLFPATLIIPSEIFISPLRVVSGGMLTSHKWVSAIPTHCCCCCCNGLFWPQLLLQWLHGRREDREGKKEEKVEGDYVSVVVMYVWLLQHTERLHPLWGLIAALEEKLMNANERMRPQSVASIHTTNSIFVVFFSSLFWCIHLWCTYKMWIHILTKCWLKINKKLFKHIFENAEKKHIWCISMKQ